MAERRSEMTTRRIVDHLANGGFVHEGNWKKNQPPVKGLAERREVWNSFYDGSAFRTLPLRPEEVDLHLGELIKQGKIVRKAVEGKEKHASGFTNELVLSPTWKPNERR